MRRSRFLHLCAASTFALSVFATAPVVISQADAAEMPPALQALSGTWRGTGVASARSGGPNESVSCKAVYTDVPADSSVKVEVTCASGNAKGTLVAFMRYGDNQTSIEGDWFQKWSTSVGEENGSFTGSMTQNSVRLNIAALGKVRARLTMRVTSANEHQVDVVGIDGGEEVEGMKVTFRR